MANDGRLAALRSRRWLLGYAQGTLVIPIGLVLYALLFWRLRLAPSAIPASPAAGAD